MGYLIKFNSSLSFLLLAGTVSLGILIILTKTNKRKTMKLKQVKLEEGWEFMQKGITKLKNMLEEGDSEAGFSSEESMMFYTTIYDMCTQKLPHEYYEQLYDKYRECIEEYITSMVLPSLREKHEEFVLRVLVSRWSNHKVIVRWLYLFFHYLDRYFIPNREFPTLNEVALACFRDLVYIKVNEKVHDAVISLINQEREGEEISRELLKNVLSIFVEIGNGEMKYCDNMILAYVNDCFDNHTLFNKALKETFEIFCNMEVAGSSSTELVATFHDNILMKESEGLSH